MCGQRRRRICPAAGIGNVRQVNTINGAAGGFAAAEGFREPKYRVPAALGKMHEIVGKRRVFAESMKENCHYHAKFAEEELGPETVSIRVFFVLIAIINNFS